MKNASKYIEDYVKKKHVSSVFYCFNSTYHPVIEKQVLKRRPQNSKTMFIKRDFD